ncbi:MAG: alpha/beta fold hydrolase [Rhodospirillaceae bacterium]|nr:alpha/beta fold hydrolase [Rhodospirillaceae bacterium]
MKAETAPMRFGAGYVGDPAVYYETLAPLEAGGKPPVVMVHGGTQTGACYLLTADSRPGWAQAFVKAGYPVVLPDWPGSGRSGAVPYDRLDGEAVCRGIGAVIEAQGGPVILVTHSMSGALGWKVLELYGDRIAKLVAIAPGPPGNIQAEPTVLSENDRHIELQSLELRFSIDKGVPHRAPMSFVEKKIVGEGGRFARAGVATMAAAMDLLAPQMIWQRLNIHGSQLKVARFDHYRGKPILVVVGSHDIDHPRALDEATADWARANGAAVDFWYLPEFGIVGNGHMMMMEDNSDEIAGLILGWIEGRPAPRKTG